MLPIKLDLAEIDRVHVALGSAKPHAVRVVCGSAFYQAAMSLPRAEGAMVAYQGVPLALNEFLPPHYAVAEMSDGTFQRFAC